MEGISISWIFIFMSQLKRKFQMDDVLVWSLNLFGIPQVLDLNVPLFLIHQNIYLTLSSPFAKHLRTMCH